MEKLEQIEEDLAVRQNEVAEAARKWFAAKREREHDEAVAFLAAEGTDTKRRMIAKKETWKTGMNEEAEYIALMAVIRTLETRSTIGMALLKTQGRS
jgi:hypothetical protein